MYLDFTKQAYVFENIPDLYYNLFMEIGLAVRPDQYLYDQDTGVPIQFKEKLIKASIDGTPVYAGRNDIVFEPDKNYNLITCLFGMYIDKCINSDDGDIIGGYIANYIYDNPEKDKQQVTIKSASRGEISSNYYYNIYLAYIDCMFRIGDTVVDLSNFDIKPERK